MTTAESKPSEPRQEQDSQQASAQHRPDASSAEQTRRRQIELAAYYAAEQRGFAGDRALDDWLEAEQRIDGRSAEAGIKHEASIAAEQPSDGALAPASDADGRDAEQERIDPADVKRWAAELAVPAPRLRDAIRNVGPLVEDVRRYLASPHS